MVKECPVIISNDAVTVVRFDNIDIQFPFLGENLKNVKVKFDDGKYTIVNENEVVDKVEDKDITEKPKQVKKQSRNRKRNN